MSPRVGYVEGWYVDPDLRGKGVGRTLVSRAEIWAREMGFTELASDAELRNDGSIRAHHALGFHETFRLVHFVKPLGKT
jgi:aminoglycoside 6'-N-acetyltransferase I